MEHLQVQTEIYWAADLKMEVFTLLTKEQST